MKYLTHYIEEEQTKALEKANAFFAFSTKQYDEQIKENVVYVSCGIGLFCEEGKVEQLAEDLENIQKIGIKADVEENGVKAIISREYFNYETQISNDGAALNSLKQYQEIFPEKFTDEVIKEVFAKSFKEACKNDWF